MFVQDKKDRLEHILKLRLKYTGRGYYIDAVRREIRLHSDELMKRFLRLGLWIADDKHLENFYQELATQISYSKSERKERKRKGYERACNRLNDIVHNAPSVLFSKEWLKYLNRLDIISGRIYSYEFSNGLKEHFDTLKLRSLFIEKVKVIDPLKTMELLQKADEILASIK